MGADWPERALRSVPAGFLRGCRVLDEAKIKRITELSDALMMVARGEDPAIVLPAIGRVAAAMIRFCYEDQDIPMVSSALVSDILNKVTGFTPDDPVYKALVEKSKDDKTEVDRCGGAILEILAGTGHDVAMSALCSSMVAEIRQAHNGAGGRQDCLDSVADMMREDLGGEPDDLTASEAKPTCH